MEPLLVLLPKRLGDPTWLFLWSVIRSVTLILAWVIECKVLRKDIQVGLHLMEHSLLVLDYTRGLVNHHCLVFVTLSHIISVSWVWEERAVKKREPA